MAGTRARLLVGAITLAAIATPAAAFARGGVGTGGRRVPVPVVPAPAPVPVVDPVVVPAPIPAPVVEPAPVVNPAPIPAPVVEPAPAPAPVVNPVPAPVVDPAPAVVQPCAAITTFKPSGGFRPSSNNSVGAIWTSFKVANCGDGAATYHMTLIETVDGRPDLYFSWSPVVTLDPRRDYSAGNIDNDDTPLDTLYHVQLEVRSDDGTLIGASDVIDVMAGETNKSLVP